jgi:hypothetical protein
LALPRSIRSWNLTALREKLVKIGAKVVAHSKYVIFQLAEVAVPANSSQRFWSGSLGCGWRVTRGDVRPAGKRRLAIVAVRPRCAARVDFGEKPRRSVLCAGFRPRR